MTKRTPTTKDINLLFQLYQSEQLILSPEFQREGVWPRAAKAYLIDTILNDRPIPLFFLQRTRSAQSGKTAYIVIDGQQRLRAIFEFLEGRFRLTESGVGKPYFKKQYKELSKTLRDHILDYSIMVDELTGYSDPDIRDIFIRMNKYVVKLSPQELRHAKHKGAFYEFAEDLGKQPFWKNQKVFTTGQMNRMRQVEFGAELAILLIEGPQDKKASVDLYYGRYQQQFKQGPSTQKLIKTYLKWIAGIVPDFKRRFIRKPVDLYGLVGALHEISEHGTALSKIRANRFVESLSRFETALQNKERTGDAARYFVAASQQTDNITPRQTRIEIMTRILLGEY